MAALGVLQVNVGVNAARDNQHAPGIEHFGAGQALSQRNYFAASDGDIGLKGVAGRYYGAVSDH
jgi:hypothetical protein